MQSDRYSPVLLECWINWRARTQEEKHGMSNWSEIPNHLYNSRRRQLAMSAQAMAGQEAEPSSSRRNLDYAAPRD